MEYKFLAALTLVLSLQTCFAPPVTQNKKENQEQPESDYGGLEDYMEYHRYLKEVVNALESDPDFRQKLEKADESDIKSGKIAEELQFVSHHVRTRLDEIKRVELQRLRELVEKKRKLEQETNTIDEDPTHHHLDHDNPHTFEIEDLKKLIAKTTQDLAEADKRRKEEFKRYELEKEFQREEKLNHTNGAEREKLEKEYKEMEEKHKKHEKLHQPGHKAQLEEVWEEQDQMQQDFDPKTFFMLHDIDGNGLWDQEEVKALFIKELDKMYQEGAPEDDMRERVEEMERMRESVFREMDANQDGFIDYREFLQQTNSNEFKQDHGWQALDEQTRPYTDEELAEYVRYHHAQVPPPYGQVPQGYPQQGVYPGGYQQVPPGAYQQQIPQNQQFHPGQVPQMAHHDLNTNEINRQPQPPQYQNVQHHNPPPNSYPPQYQQQDRQNQPQYQQPNVAVNQQNQNNQQQYQQPGQVGSHQQNVGGNVPYQQPPVPQQNINNQQNVLGNAPYQQPPVPQQNINNQPQYQQQNAPPQQQQQAIPPQQQNVHQPQQNQGNFQQQQANLNSKQINQQPNVQLL